MRILKISAFQFSLFVAVFFCGFQTQAADKYYYVSAEKIVEYVYSKPGKRVVLIYASWCPYCREKLPGLMDLERQKKGSVIAVSVDENPDTLMRYLGGFQSIPFHVFVSKDIASGAVEKQFGAKARTGIPYVILLDEDSNLHAAGNYSTEYIAEYILK